MRCFQSPRALSSHAPISQTILTHGSVGNMTVTFPGPGRAAPRTLRITTAFPTECNLVDTHKHFEETCCLSCPSTKLHAVTCIKQQFSQLPVSELQTALRNKGLTSAVITNEPKRILNVYV